MSWERKLLSADSARREYIWTDSDGNVTLETQWLVDPIAEDCKASFNTFDERAGWKGDMHHVARIPYWVIEYEWRVNRRKMLTDKDFVRHWVNDPENRAFRVRPGKI
jgi:hypothetical protein